MSKKLLTGSDHNNQRGINVADPTSATDIANKQYVDNRVEGLTYKIAVRAASVANSNITTAYINGQSLDGVTLVTGDRILLKDQTTQSDNGIYTVNSSGAPTRAADANTTAELNNATVTVVEGTLSGGKEYTQTTKNPTVGTSNIVWALKATSAPTSGSGAISVAGTAVSFVPKGSGGLAQDGSGAYIDTTTFGQGIKGYSGDVPAGSNPATVTHNLGTVDRLGEPLLTIKSTGEIVEADVLVGTNADTITFSAAPTAAQYRYSTARIV